MNNTHSSFVMLLALGVLSLAGAPPAAAQVDTSQWKCERCPYPKAGAAQLQGAADGGLILVKGRTRSLGDWTGLDGEKAYALLGGELSYRGAGGYFADATAAELGTDARSLEASSGRAGLYALRLGYAEIPRRHAEGALTPFLGSGGNVLTLPAGYPAATTASMPLGASLRPAAMDLEHSRLDLGAAFTGQARWTYRVDVRRDTREGTRPTSGSFFSTAAQLPAPVDEVTDQLQASATYVAPAWHFAVGYLLSRFDNGNDSLTWSNPFNPVAGGTTGRLSLAPDNRFQQVSASGGWQVLPVLRASAELALGQGTQNMALLPATLNTSLAGVAALPAASLDGQVDTFNASVKLTATPLPDLRLTGSWARDVRDNQTPVRAWQQVSTDMFVGAARSNTPFDITQDRFKFAADYRAPSSLPGHWRFAGGLDWDQKERSFQEVVTTRETTVWGRAGAQPLEGLSVGINAAWARRDASTYGVAFWFPTVNNPAMRKLNLAERERMKFGAQVEWAASDKLTVSLGGEFADDDYPDTTLGLKDARTEALNLALAFNVSEDTQIQAYAAGERVRSRQAGSQVFAAPDWSGTVKDRFELAGLSIRHAAIPDKLELGGELSTSRAKGDVAVQTGLLEPDYPSVTTHRDTARLWASFKLADNLWLNGSWSYESVSTSNWALDGVAAGTVFNLLAFGNLPPRYHVNMVRASVRYRF
ncbi:MAG: MtrB/PioB family decaheme-associated outer membrane protein [Rubrivivax sp.]|nr:MtrB/PioB family decaheme-associated outer membrane protein [Rubrivivax sp.]